MATLYNELERCSTIPYNLFTRTAYYQKLDNTEDLYTYVHSSGMVSIDNTYNKLREVAVGMCALYAGSGTKLVPTGKRNAPVATKLSSCEIQ